MSDPVESALRQAATSALRTYELAHDALRAYQLATDQEHAHHDAASVAMVPLIGQTRPEQPRTALRAVPPVWRPGDGPTGSGDDDLRAASLERAGAAWRSTVLVPSECDVAWQDLGSGPGVAVCTTHRRAAVLCGARPVPHGEPEPRMAPHTRDCDEAMRRGCTCTWEQTIDDPTPRLVSVAVDCPL